VMIDHSIPLSVVMRRGCEIVVCHESDKKSAQHTYEVLSRWEGIGRPADLQKGNVDCLGIVSAARDVKNVRIGKLPVYAPLTGFDSDEIDRFRDIVLQSGSM
jgi:adenylyl- and sulfurtransferase ThiI